MEQGPEAYFMPQRKTAAKDAVVRGFIAPDGPGGREQDPLGNYRAGMRRRSRSSEGQLYSVVRCMVVIENLLVDIQRNTPAIG